MGKRRGDAVRGCASRLGRRSGLAWAGIAGLLAWGQIGCGTDMASEGRSSNGQPKAANEEDDESREQSRDASSKNEAPPPEVKVEKTFEAPVATKNRIWSANPKSGRVVLIDATTFKVEPVQSGDSPRYMAAVPGAQEDRVVVINSGGSDATLLTATNPGISVRRYGVHEGANAWSVSADGRWAIAWSDVSRYAAALGSNTTIAQVDSRLGFQQLSVLDLTESSDAGVPITAPRIAVGYRPTQVVFAASGLEAYAVTADGISVIDLSVPGKPAFLRNIRYACQPPADVVNDDTQDAGLSGDSGGQNEPVDAGADPGNGDHADGGAFYADAWADGGVDGEGGPAEAGSPATDATSGTGPDAGGSSPKADAGDPDAASADADAGNACLEGLTQRSATPPDVSITPDGHYAIVRREGSAMLDMVDLKTSVHTLTTLSGAITDASLSSDGTKAIAVVRNTSQVAVFSVPIAAGTTPAYADWRLEGQTVGRGIITQHNKSALLFTTIQAVPRIVVLPLDGSAGPRSIDLSAPVYAVFPTPDDAHAIVLHPTNKASATVAGAFSIVPLSQDRPPLIVATEAAPQQVAIAPDSVTALVSTSDAKTKHVAYVARMPELRLDEYDLATAPTAVGVVATMGYVAQEHAEGRVTFIDLTRSAGAAHTMTGFELGASIVQWPTRDGGSR